MPFSSNLWSDMETSDKDHSKIANKTFKTIFYCIWAYSKQFLIRNSRVPNAPFSRQGFCPFWGHYWKSWNATHLRFSRYLIYIMIKKCKKLYGHGLYGIYATTNWKSVPVPLTHPVVFSVASFYCLEFLSLQKHS